MTPVEPESVVFGATDEMANAYKDERAPLSEDLATPAGVVERESLLATDSCPRTWGSPEFGEQETAMEAVVAGNGNVSEIGSKPSTTVAAERNTMMETSMGVGVVS
ncbi:hypothetical protein PC119_g24163 [Phytophthora cactorum]|uniref:Uncharacterized protein n=1 Tax=Phytophthora cactorum TaxID=29920 RepID=A0A8T1B0C5_9STRA|nr:hypothetical protein PC117_g24399 [Phytophthora cactorum]KAG2914595.1 hypothetical protein PC114_g8132 [Phytophthora cactorum]KAG2968636.1 hypothetical protein PC119_g24163 [Phytophthora cactorum]KAG3043887.1 hypothetical protein PC121_g22273 [Phytophthora cactorum]KAG3175366.1 hypothetical protein PC128_g17801 [Phytophthora cactorum]